MDEVTRKRFERRLAPGAIRKNLVRAALFLVTYELLEIEIVEKTRSFLCNWDPRAESPDYREKILSRVKEKKNRRKNGSTVYHASCQWLQEEGVVTADDVGLLARIYTHRNKVAHELPALLVDPSFDVDLDLFEEAARLIAVVGRFWTRLEVNANPAFDGQDVQHEDIQSAGMVLMEYLLSIVRARDV